MDKARLNLRLMIISLFFMIFVIGLNPMVKAGNSDMVTNRSVIRLKITKKNDIVLYATGFVVGKQGKNSEKYIITAAHVLEDYKKIETNLPSISEAIELIPKSIGNKANIASLTIASGSKNEFKPLKVGNSEKIKIGDSLIYWGYPDESVENPNPNPITISDVDSNPNFKCLSATGDLNSEKYFGSPVFNKRGGVVGLIIPSTTNDRTDIVYINYLLNVLSADDYETEEAGMKMIILLTVGFVVVLLAVLTVVLVMLKKKKQQSYSQKEAPIEHSDGRTVAIVPGSSKANSSESASGIGIIGVSGYFMGRKFPIAKHVIIGRDPKKVKIVFPDKTQGVSAVHCELRNSNGLLTLVDLGSTYGTFLANGTKLQPSIPCAISIGDEFYLGSSENRFKVSA